MLTRSDLHPYQERGLKFVLEKARCGLFLDLGLGKTIISLTALSDWLDSFTARKALVIAPLRVAQSVWAQEAAKWEHTKHLKVSKILGTENDRLAALRCDADIYVINRENIPWLVKILGRRWPFETVVVDESSSFKGHQTKRFRALRCVLPKIDRIVLLTGTPAGNSLMDLWSQIFLIDRGEALGRTITSYRKTYFESDFMGWKWMIRPGASGEIYKSLDPILMSMKAGDYLSVPERIDITIEMDLGPALMRRYDDFRRQSVLNLPNGAVEATSAGILAGKLLQFCSGAIYNGTEDRSWTLIHDAKLDALEELVEDNGGENLMVAYRYRSDLNRLRERFPDAVMLDDQESIDRWNRGEIRMLLVHPAKAAHGLNLQAGGSILIWFGLEWSLELYQQLIGRINRQGQTKPVKVIHLVAKGTFDERVMEVLKQKDQTQTALLSALKKEIGKAND